MTLTMMKTMMLMLFKFVLCLVHVIYFFGMPNFLVDSIT